MNGLNEFFCHGKCPFYLLTKLIMDVPEFPSELNTIIYLYENIIVHNENK